MTTKWIHGTKTQVDGWREALKTAIGAPFRGRDINGNPKGPETPGIGWTLEATDAPIDGPGNTAALEIGSKLLPFLGQTHAGKALPSQASAVAMSELPPGLRTAVYARKGLNSDGNPLTDNVVMSEKERLGKLNGR